MRLAKRSVAAEFLVELGQAAGMLVVGGLEQHGGPFVADERPGGEHRGQLADLDEPFSDLGLKGVHDHASADGGAGRHGRVHSVDRRHGVADRCAGVEDEVGEVLQFLPGRMPAVAGLGMVAADQRDDLDAALLKLLRDLDRDDIATA